MNVAYTYDPIGNITAITNMLDDTQSKTYGYDAVNRLANATGPWGTLGWTYDANGNRLTQTGAANNTYTYSANRLATVNGTSYRYDNNGNTTGDGVKAFIYNQNQRLITVTQNSKTLGQYTYNAKGQRVIKTTGPATASSSSLQNEVYTYDLSGRLIEETDGNGKLIADYVYMSGNPLAMITKQGNGEATFYYHNDHLGTPNMMTDKLQKVVWNVEFDPFGNDLSQNGRGGSYIRNVTNNLRFPGQYYDAETGLNYNYYRDYNPVIGRYIETDPLGIKGGMNPFVYVGQDPINRNDPTGLCPNCKNWRGQATRGMNVACTCYWLCIDPPSIWEGNWHSLPTTKGIVINTGGDPESGDACLCADPNGGGPYNVSFELP